MKRLLIFSDTHHPYVHKRAWAVFLKVCAGFKPDICICIGDWADNHNLSRHRKDPTRNELYKTTLKKLNLERQKLDEALSKKCRKIFIAGNHDYWLARTIDETLPVLHGLLEYPKLLGFTKDNGWEYHPYIENEDRTPEVEIGRILYTHDLDYGGRYIAHKSLDAAQYNIVVGHGHRMALAVEGTITGKVHIGASFGWLGDRRYAQYKKCALSKRDWALGFGAGYMNKRGQTWLIPVPIVQNKCIVEGKEYKG